MGTQLPIQAFMDTNRPTRIRDVRSALADFIQIGLFLLAVGLACLNAVDPDWKSQLLNHRMVQFLVAIVILQFLVYLYSWNRRHHDNKIDHRQEFKRLRKERIYSP